MAAKKEWSAEESAEIRKLWRKLVNLFHPDRFANEPGKRESYERLTAAINQAKDNGDLATLREIANDPEGYLLRQGWARLDFGDERQAGPLRRLWESLELEIVRVLEAMNELRACREFELAQLIEKDAGLLDRVVAKQHAGIES